jgi:hypothetical protein
VVFFGGRDRLTLEQADAIIATNYHEIIAHGYTHNPWALMDEAGRTADAKECRAWWLSRYGPEFSACKVIGPPIFGTTATVSTALSNGWSWALGNQLKPPEGSYLPPGYAYRWQMLYTGQLTAVVKGLTWAQKPNNVLFIAIHRLTDDPKRPRETLRADFLAAVKAVQDKGIGTTTILELAGLANC